MGGLGSYPDLGHTFGFETRRRSAGRRVRYALGPGLCFTEGFISPPHYLHSFRTLSRACFHGGLEV